MANRTFFQDVSCNRPGLVLVTCKFTGAADVAANGYTVNKGVAHVTSVTRTGEGAATIALADRYTELVGVLPTISKADTSIRLVADDVAGASGGPNIDIEYITAGAAADPDSAVTWLLIALKNSSVG